MSENLIHRLLPHQGCVITPTGDGIEIAGSAMNWVMSAGVAPFACRAPFVFRVVGKTDSTNLRMHWHRGELIFNWECNVRELRVHDPATAKQHGLEGKGFISTADWHEIVWEIRLDRMRVIVDGGTTARGTIRASSPPPRSDRASAAPSRYASSRSRRWREPTTARWTRTAHSAGSIRSITALASSVSRYNRPSRPCFTSRNRRCRSTSSDSRRSSSRFLLIRIRCSCPVPGISP